VYNYSKNHKCLVKVDADKNETITDAIVDPRDANSAIVLMTQYLC
jgi:hypothetical protein